MYKKLFYIILGICLMNSCKKNNTYTTHNNQQKSEVYPFHIQYDTVSLTNQILHEKLDSCEKVSRILAPHTPKILQLMQEGFFNFNTLSLTPNCSDLELAEVREKSITLANLKQLKDIIPMVEISFIETCFTKKLFNQISYIAKKSNNRQLEQTDLHCIYFYLSFCNDNFHRHTLIHYNNLDYTNRNPNEQFLSTNWAYAIRKVYQHPNRFPCGCNLDSMVFTSNVLHRKLDSLEKIRKMLFPHNDTIIELMQARYLQYNIPTLNYLDSDFEGKVNISENCITLENMQYLKAILPQKDLIFLENCFKNKLLCQISYVFKNTNTKKRDNYKLRCIYFHILLCNNTSEQHTFIYYINPINWKINSNDEVKLTKNWIYTNYTL